MFYSISIYQCPAKVDYCFREYDEDRFNLSDYDKVYEINGDIDSTVDDDTLLNDTFYYFNCGDYPEDYKGRSLSVSDIVCVNNRYYYCQPFGWHRLDI